MRKIWIRMPHMEMIRVRGRKEELKNMCTIKYERLVKMKCQKKT